MRETREDCARKRGSTREGHDAGRKREKNIKDDNRRHVTGKTRRKEPKEETDRRDTEKTRRKGTNEAAVEERTGIG